MLISLLAHIDIKAQNKIIEWNQIRISSRTFKSIVLVTK